MHRIAAFLVFLASTSSALAFRPIGSETAADLLSEPELEAVAFVNGVASYATIVQDAGLPIMPEWRIEFINCMTQIDPKAIYDASGRMVVNQPTLGKLPAISVVLRAIDTLCPRPPDRAGLR